MTETFQITGAQLRRLRDDGWMESAAGGQGWRRWVGEAEVGDVGAAQKVWQWGKGWYACDAYGNPGDIDMKTFPTIDGALDQCDEWKGGLEVASAPG